MDSRMRTFAFVTGVAAVSAEICPDFDKTDILIDDRFANAVNYYRCLHGQPEVVTESLLKTKAQTNLAACPAASNGGTYNVYTDGTNVENAVESWYQQRFSSPTLKLLGAKAETEFVTAGVVKSDLQDFTAMMWTSVTKLGCTIKSACPTTGTPKTGSALCRFGIPKADSTVEFTSPNVATKFIVNLPRSLAFKKSRGDCCTEIYGTSLPSVAKPKVGYGGETLAPTPKPTVYGESLAPTPTPTVYELDCSSFTCPVGSADINKGKNIKCGALCTAALCCQSYATCDTLICPSGASGSAAKICGKNGLARTIKECVAADCCPRANCGSFTGCTGKDAAGVPIKKNAGISVLCTGSEATCDIDTCCTIPLDEDTCFPGEAEVSVQDRSGMRVDEIEPGMTVFAETGFEPVFGMLHLHSAVSPTFAHATTASV